MGTKRVQSAANFELATRSLAGSIIYPCIALILYTWSPFYSHHPLLSFTFMTLLVLVGWERVRVARRIKASLGEAPESDSLRLHRVTLATAVIWGIFAGWGIYNHDDVTRWMILTADGSLASGAIASLSPGKDRLFLKYLVLLLAPSLVVMLLSAGQVSRATGWIALGFAILVG
ncbi:MAG: hypothetical protein KC910_04650, partial [Candidatus Eremiobacteraeota bacterium]|nr:hypothetical protein [Candidatus Eremiobacteraeota bacterium]